MAIIKKDQLKKNKQLEIVSEQEFLSKAEDYNPTILNTDLSKLSLDDLADQYNEIDRQSHLLKGRILLEARSRFESDKEFGQWVATHSLCVGSQQQRNRLMHLADFFKEEKELESISITAAYAISAPVYREVARLVYDEVKGKDVAVKEVKALLNEKAPQNNQNENKKSDLEPDSNQLAEKLVNRTLSHYSNEFKMDVLKKAMKLLKKEMSS